MRTGVALEAICEGTMGAIENDQDDVAGGVNVTKPYGLATTSKASL